MTYKMEIGLKSAILAQHREADGFCKIPGNWMGKVPDPSNTQYWSERVPTGTLKEWNRIQLVEDAYYTTAEIVSKSFARSKDFANWSDERIMRYMENAFGVRYDR